MNAEKGEDRVVETSTERKVGVLSVEEEVINREIALNLEDTLHLAPTQDPDHILQDPRQGQLAERSTESPTEEDQVTQANQEGLLSIQENKADPTRKDPSHPQNLDLIPKTNLQSPIGLQVDLRRKMELKTRMGKKRCLK